MLLVRVQFEKDPHIGVMFRCLCIVYIPEENVDIRKKLSVLAFDISYLVHALCSHLPVA